MHNHTAKKPAAGAPVTVAITQHIRPGKEAAFETWLRGIGDAAAQFPGHQGLVLVPPNGAEPAYTYLFRFDNDAHLQAWENSPQKALWVAKLDDLLETPAQKRFVTGLEYWFRLPGNAATAPPPHYKMAVVTVLAIYPLSLIVPPVLQPLLQPVPPLAGALVRACVLVALMTYVVMPLMVKLFAGWLFKNQPK